MSAAPSLPVVEPPLRVLVVEDCDDDFVLLLRELSRGGYRVDATRVQTIDALRAALASSTEWQIVLSDFSLPGMTAHDVLLTVKRSARDIPCIVISGTISEETAVDVLREGARDFIVKDRMARLVPAIDRELREARERRRLETAERSEQETRQRMHFVLDAVGMGFWEWEIGSGRVLWSEVQERLHGAVPGSFGGTFDAFVSHVHGEDRRAVLQQADEVRRDAPDVRVEYRTLWPDGSVHWIAMIGRVFRDAGQPVHAAGVAMDITAQKRLEEQLRQAQKMESIGNLAGGIAHDFNNLLTVIAGSCELAAELAACTPALAEPLEEIRSAAMSATSLTRQLLTFSRRQIVTPRLVALNDAVAGFQSILRRLIEENVHIEMALAPSLPRVHVDPGQIEQVLLNLAANARDAMPDGGTLRIRTCSQTVTANDAVEQLGVQAGPWVVLSVSDTGAGMSRDVQAHLFEPFFTTKPAGRGTGLGLATVYGIVTQSGGHVFVDSAVGRGTTFRVYLPAVPDAAAPATVPRADATPDVGGSETVLVVEDNAALRRLNERVLRRYGYTVLTAANGAQARQVCTEHPGPIHVALMDVIMPGDSGPAVAEWISKHRPDTRIIFTSGYTGDAVSRSRVLDAASTTFLQKPFESPQLARAIRDVLAPDHRAGRE